jgi:transposase
MDGTDASPAPATDQADQRLDAHSTSRSNARIEQINTQIRLIARRAFGFHTPQALIALAMLKLAHLCPPLPR